MANWCTTWYTVCSDNQEMLYTIFNAINKCNEMKEPITPHSAPNWTGNIFKELGIEAETGRSFWSEATLKNGELKFTESSAWNRDDAIVLLQEHYCDNGTADYGDFVIYFCSEEFGCGIYETNDEDGEYYPERFCWIGEDDWEYFNCFEDLEIAVRNFLEVDTDFDDVDAINEALEKAEEEHGSQHVYEIEITEL